MHTPLLDSLNYIEPAGFGVEQFGLVELLLPLVILRSIDLALFLVVVFLFLTHRTPVLLDLLHDLL